MNIIKSLPTPIAGLALGSVALGNLLQPYSSSLQLLFNLLSLIIIVLLTIKFTLGYDELKKEMENPVIATVLATYPMSIMLLASFSKKYKDGDYPTITVFSAPGGLLLASYMIGVTQKSNIILAILIPLTILLFIFVLIQLPYLLKRKFYPSFSAFTFPLVICAISFQKTGIYYQITEFSILNILIHLTELLALIIVIYVWYGFIKNLFYSN